MKKLKLIIVGIVVSGLMIIGCNAQAKDILMIAPLIPPHFDEQGNGRIGDVIQATLAECGHTVRFEIVPFGRHWKNYNDYSKYDGLATAEADQVFPGFTTRPFHHLQDGAMVLENSDLAKIQNVYELKDKRIFSFPKADKILGISHMVSQFKSFSMRSDRFEQVRPLLGGRSDAVLADGLISAHFILQLKERIEAGKEPHIQWSPVVYRRIFAKGPQRLYFRDKTLSENFNRCYKTLEERGDVERITKPYLEKYQTIIKDQYPSY